MVIRVGARARARAGQVSRASKGLDGLQSRLLLSIKARARNGSGEKHSTEQRWGVEKQVGGSWRQGTGKGVAGGFAGGYHLCQTRGSREAAVLIWPSVACSFGAGAED